MALLRHQQSTALTSPDGSFGLSAHCPEGWLEEARLGAYAAAQLCDALAGGRHRPAHHSGLAGSSSPAHDGTLHLRVAGARGRDEESVGSVGSTCAGNRSLLTRPTLEVADILREYTPAFLEVYGDTISPQQRRVLRDLARCRTAALGGHLECCDHCGHQRPAYNSCRNRHCPKCQAATR